MFGARSHAPPAAVALIQARLPPARGSVWRRRARRAHAEIVRLERARRVNHARGDFHATDGLHLDMKRIQSIVQEYFKDDETSAVAVDELATDETSSDLATATTQARRRPENAGSAIARCGTVGRCAKNGR